MAVVVIQSDRESFQRCRRQWDLQARMRRNLAPAAPPAGPDLPAALRAALAVYYFPGLWDWDRAITMPLVRQGLDRELARQQERGASAPQAPGWRQAQAALQRLLGRYAAWAPGADMFSPVLIDADFEVQLPDPARPGGGLTGADGQPVRFRGRIQLLAVDDHDAYWLVRHALRTSGWPDTSELAAAEDALADAWAWEQFYPGLSVTGTIHNEMRLDGADTAQPDTPDPAGNRTQWKFGGHFRPRNFHLERFRRAQSAATQGTGPLVRQHEPSGGGRSIPQHRRLYARAREPVAAEPIEQVTAGEFRRTRVRHSPAAIAAAGRRLAGDAAAMVAAGALAVPNPSDSNCRSCAFLPPCLAMRAGRDSEFLLRSGFRTRPPDVLEEGRLGGGAWAMGRGAAPFRRG